MEGLEGVTLHQTGVAQSLVIDRKHAEKKRDRGSEFSVKNEGKEEVGMKSAAHEKDHLAKNYPDLFVKWKGSEQHENFKGMYLRVF